MPKIKIKSINIIVGFFTLLRVFHAHALVIHQDEISNFIGKSKAESNRVFVLKIGATWCKPCHLEHELLVSVLEGQNSSTQRAYWSEINVDKDLLQNKVLQSLFTDWGIPAVRSFPSNLAFVNGVPFGSLVGGNARALEAFLNDIEGSRSAITLATVGSSPNRSEDRSEDIEFPFMCPNGFGQTSSENSSHSVNSTRPDAIIGVVGSSHQGIGPDDEFGRLNLESYQKFYSRVPIFFRFTPEPSKLVAVQTPSRNGTFFIKRKSASPEKGIVNVSGARDEAYQALRNMSSLKGSHIRLFFTGHGAPSGVEVKPSGSESVLIDSQSMVNWVRQARSYGKKVDTVMVQCFGGKMASAFMPMDGFGQACGAFAALPEKESEGCYNYGANHQRRVDYLYSLFSLKSCSVPQKGRELHYDIVSFIPSHDIPMLTSEYFLIYGSPASYLLAGAKRRGLVAVHAPLYDPSKPFMAIPQNLPADPKLRVMALTRWNFIAKRRVSPTRNLSLQKVPEIVPEVQLALLENYIFPYLNKAKDLSQFLLLIFDLSSELAQFDPERAKAILNLLQQVQGDRLFSAPKFMDMIKANFTLRKVDLYEIHLARLAHLVTVSVLEIELRKLATLDFNAKTSVRQLSELKECEDRLW